MDFMEKHKVVHVAPSAIIAANEDYSNGNPATDVVNMKDWNRITFIIIKNAGAVGTATITVESCDDVVPTIATAIAFKYRKCTVIDTFGVWTDALAAGFVTTAGADQIYEITVTADQLTTTNQYVRMQVTEVDSTACDGAVVAIMTEPRYAEDINDTVLV